MPTQKFFTLPAATTIVAITLLFSSSAYSAKSTSPQPLLPTTGVMLDLTGEQSSLGQQAMNGFLLALQQQKIKESTNNLYSINNTQSKTMLAKSAAKSLISKISVGTGFTDNNAVIAVAPYFEKNKVPFLSIGATDPSLVQQYKQSVFLVPFGDNTQAAAAAEFSVKKFGKNAIVLWDSTSNYTKSLPKYFATRYQQLGGKILLNQSYKGGCDISSLAKKISSTATNS